MTLSETVCQSWYQWWLNSFPNPFSTLWNFIGNVEANQNIWHPEKWHPRDLMPKHDKFETIFFVRLGHGNLLGVLHSVPCIYSDATIHGTGYGSLQAASRYSTRSLVAVECCTHASACLSHDNSSNRFHNYHKFGYATIRSFAMPTDEFFSCSKVTTTTCTRYFLRWGWLWILQLRISGNNNVFVAHGRFLPIPTTLRELVVVVVAS